MTRTYLKFEDYFVEKLQDPQEGKAHLELAISEYEKDFDTAAFMLMLGLMLKLKVVFLDYLNALT